jgi:6-phosphogluconolactonase (cycloisomerase 2 family)
MSKSFLVMASTIVLLTTVLIGCGTYGNNMPPATQVAKFVYVANSADNSISVFSMDSASGQLSKIGQTPSGGVHPISIKADPAGKFLYVAHSASGDVSTFAIDRNSGAWQ